MSDNFTPEQSKELDERAEARDLDPSRSSIFSDGEQIELDIRDELRGFTHFSSEQRLELDKLAELRDLRRPRKSTFSVDEQQELDDTASVLRAEGAETAKVLRAENAKRAKDLRFNDIQNADLAHRFNKVKQTELTFRFRHRFLPYVISGLLIAVGLVDWISQTSHNQQSSNAAIAVFCQQHHLGHCNP